jgi:hypothetical protein
MKAWLLLVGATHAQSTFVLSQPARHAHRSHDPRTVGVTCFRLPWGLQETLARHAHRSRDPRDRQAASARPRPLTPHPTSQPGNHNRGFIQFIILYLINSFFFRKRLKKWKKNLFFTFEFKETITTFY